ncbi:MAG: site-specific integrase [Butyribacter sp.]|nr:site-specific integrase [Butyribacter sp.]
MFNSITIARTSNQTTVDIKKILLQLQELADCANIPLSEVLNDNISMSDSKQKLETIILENHKYNIYYSENEKAWRTYLPDETKPSKRKPIKRNSKSNLEKAIIEFYLEKQRNEARNNISLKDIYKEWLLYRRDYTSVKPKTIQENVSDWNTFFKDTQLANMPLKEIYPITLIRFFREVTKNRTYTHKRISNARSILNGIMSYAIEEELISHNPVSDVDFSMFCYKPVENQSNNVFSKEEATTLLTYLQSINEPYALAIQLSFYLFIRVGETKALRWNDVDWDKKTIYLHGQVLTERNLNDDLTFSKRKVTISNQMKGNTSHGFRTQYLTENAIIILQKAHALNPDGEYIFEPNGNVMTTDSFNRRLKKYCKECGIPYYSSHKIRFFNASTAYNGENLVTISRLMGHSEVETTLHYLRNVHKEDDNISAFQGLGLSSK